MVTAVNTRATKYGVDSGSVAYFFALPSHLQLTALSERAIACRIKCCNVLTQTLSQKASTSSAARQFIANTPGTWHA